MHLVPGNWTAEIFLQRELKSFCNCLAVGFPKVTMTPQGPQVVVVVGPGVLLVSRVLQLIHLLFTGEICMETRNPPSRNEKIQSINKHKQTASSSSRVFSFYIFALAEIHATHTDKDTIFVHYRLVRRTIEYKEKRQNSMLKSSIYLYLLQWMMLPSSKN